MDEATRELHEDEGSILFVLLDVNPLAWGSSSLSAESFEVLLNHLAVFLRTFLLLNGRNRVNVFAYSPMNCTRLDGSDQPYSEPTIARLLGGVRDQISTAPKSGWRGGELKLSKALSLATLGVSRELEADDSLRPRLLIFSASPDPLTQHIAVMNAAVALKRLRVPIDSVSFGPTGSTFCQQLALLTGGIALQLARPDQDLFSLLSSTVLCDLYSRQHLPQPLLSEIDLSAPCFCHNRRTAKGVLCSSCLSLFCEPFKKCATCGAEIDSAAAKPTIL